MLENNGEASRRRRRYAKRVHAKKQTKKFTSPPLHKKAIAVICLCINYVKIMKYSVNVRDTLHSSLAALPAVRDAIDG
jgi:hypothetical protein